MTGPSRPGHDGGGLGRSPMEPSAKRALLLPAWLERKLYGRVAGFLACGLRPHQGVVTGGVRALLRALRGTAAVRVVGRGVPAP